MAQPISNGAHSSACLKRSRNGRPKAGASPPSTPNAAALKLPLYKYMPLAENSIRILKIFPTLKQDAQKHGGAEIKVGKRLLVCGIEHVSLKSPVRYEALSYVWGEAKDLYFGKRLRIVNPKKAGLASEITVTSNLAQALRALRLPNKPRYLWIDAVCINQQDELEKTRQVKLMSEIFQGASNVCIWLGPEDEGSSRVPSLIKSILNWGTTVEEKVTKDTYTSKWRAFGSLIRRPWFSRRWCVQEIALAKQATVHFGKNVVQWQDFADAVSIYEENSENILRLLVCHLRNEVGFRKTAVHIEAQAPGAANLVETLSNLFRKTSDGRITQRLITMETLMSVLSNYSVTQPRDVIYAILSIAKDTFNKNPIPIRMGTDDKETLKVYINFVKHAVKESGSLDIICVPWAPPLQDVQMPSWIGRQTECAFSQNDPRSILNNSKYGNFVRVNADTLVGRADRKIYNATSGSKRETITPILLETGQYRILVDGQVVARIKQTEECATGGDIPFSWLTTAVKAEERRENLRQPSTTNQQVTTTGVPSSRRDNRGEESGQTRPQSNEGSTATGSRIPEGFWRTLVADRGPGGTTPPAWFQRACQKSFPNIEKARRERQRGARGKIFTSEEIQKVICDERGYVHRPALQFLRRLQAVTWNRRLMVTYNNSIGLVPSAARPDDLICLLWGCSVPVVLRSHGSYYTLVGECYFHGVMNGEQMTEDYLTHPSNRQFDIR
ncbi:hypothetical protein BP6252_05726 [Coleophoma cylindrospora]|uniref:Heterokaryon incompatibility domain-containing protein n=1 Tax=Coleophoma cylindrospora TaxID=1849047 RepID=A0A3D8RUF8_9HELO|nr:hypothetical protein BP6252_05726 [Coleophoma cylindrospora]